LDRLQTAERNRNTPLYFGEWAVTTGFNATEEFMFKWADAQKLAYGKGLGWTYWNFKTELLDPMGVEMARQWWVLLSFMTFGTLSLMPFPFVGRTRKE
jgi:hypothetical protein